MSLGYIRYRKIANHPLISDFLKLSATLDRLFNGCDIDYTCPINIKTHRITGYKLTECYIVLFMRMPIKSVQ